MRVLVRVEDKANGYIYHKGLVPKPTLRNLGESET